MRHSTALMMTTAVGKPVGRLFTSSLVPLPWAHRYGLSLSHRTSQLSPATLRSGRKSLRRVNAELQPLLLPPRAQLLHERI